MTAGDVHGKKQPPNTWTKKQQHQRPLRTGICWTHSNKDDICCFQLSDTTDTLDRPVIIMRGPDAAKLMGIVNTQSEARIRIIYSPQENEEQQAEVRSAFVFFPFLSLSLSFLSFPLPFCVCLDRSTHTCLPSFVRLV